MFETLSDRLSTIFRNLKRRTSLTVDDVNQVMREVRIALLEADVALPIVKTFIEQVKEKAIGQDILRSLSPEQTIIKIVHDHLVDLLGAQQTPLILTGPAPLCYLMVGLQGSGKTTHSA